jgi:hypothetical protein
MLQFDVSLPLAMHALSKTPAELQSRDLLFDFPRHVKHLRAAWLSALFKHIRRVHLDARPEGASVLSLCRPCMLRCHG